MLDARIQSETRNNKTSQPELETIQLFTPFSCELAALEHCLTRRAFICKCKFFGLYSGTPI